MKRLVLITFVCALVIGCFAAPANACPGCRDALAAGTDANRTPWDGVQDDAGAAYSYSVLFLLAMPFLLMLGFGGTFWYLSRPKQTVAAVREIEAVPSGLEPRLT